MKNLSLLFFTFFIFTGAFGQYSNYKALGDKAFKNKDYYQAAYYYKLIADSGYALNGKIPFYSGGKITKAKIIAEHPYICFQLAESYRLNYNDHDAKEWYHQIISGNHEQTYPLARLWYGVCLRADAEFEVSIKQLNEFKAGCKGDIRFTGIADQEIANCRFALQQYHSPSLISIIKMEGKWNAEAGNYALSKNGNDYWFTSSRLNGPDGKHTNNIYSASAQNAFNPVFVSLKNDNGAQGMEYGTPSVDASGTRMYLTGWYKKGPATFLTIYYTQLSSDKWSALKKLNNNVNADNYNAMQPFVTGDGKRLFFVSDKPGGQGGKDIWMSDLDDEGNPVNSVNLGNVINTPLDEQAPFYDAARKRLVYSSRGFVGIGGFDLFESFGEQGKWSAPKNLGYPLNSPKDDLYYFGDTSDSDKMYLSSDRGSDCCLALFEARDKESYIVGKVIDCDSNTVLKSVVVSLIDSTSKQTVKQQPAGNGNYVFKTTLKHSYQLKVEKPGYFTKIISVTAKPLNDTLINADICLKPFKINKPIEIKNILYDYAKATLRPESRVALDGLVTIMKDNPGIKIELSSHTDSVGSDAYNLNLSQQRAQACVDYIISNGISTDRITAKGYGKSRPIAPNSFPDGKDNPEGRQLNRRTEFTVEK